ncbi:large conductance mechanosensitive channel protein MscL [Paracoccus laeviglucosivorans]|uniref:Large-conductance mechanosensitive channel n=1 Tax=Paracoccus laeviglucosivorans TaxID=1197861 RepID=A0A521DZJ5_9RHOB|nr:large conductance mechanosensitive channel protein MscL [Paracoccus laeviglucosivorans]SMO76501.1 large conductance mechanosensitive channel [Paracoccus laeviglucosivorans]
MIKEFKQFIARGNVVDLAVGIIIGAAFTAIVNSLVADLINPIIGLVTGGTDFSGHYFVLKGEVPPGASLATARNTGASVFAWGAFMSSVINFLIIAWAVFLLVKAVNKLQSSTIGKAEAAPSGPTQEELLVEIRDELRARRA